MSVSLNLFAATQFQDSKSNSQSPTDDENSFEGVNVEPPHPEVSYQSQIRSDLPTPFTGYEIICRKAEKLLEDNQNVDEIKGFFKRLRLQTKCCACLLACARYPNAAKVFLPLIMTSEWRSFFWAKREKSFFECFIDCVVRTGSTEDIVKMLIGSLNSSDENLACSVCSALKPKQLTKTQIAKVLSAAIDDKQENMNGYNFAIEMLRSIKCLSFPWPVFEYEVLTFPPKGRHEGNLFEFWNTNRENLYAIVRESTSSCKEPRKSTLEMVKDGCQDYRGWTGSFFHVD